MNKLSAVLGLLVLSLLAPARAELPQYVIRDLGTFGGLEARATGVNESGQVVGYTYNSDGSYRAFFWDGTMHDLGSGRALGINDSAVVVGTDGYQGFRWDGVRSAITGMSALAINNDGWIVGFDDPSQRPVLLRNGLIELLGSIGGASGMALAVNNNGQIVGSAETYPNVKSNHAFLWANGIMRDLGTYAGPQSEAVAINDIGAVVGWTNVPPVDPSPNFGRLSFVWDGQMHILEGGQNVQGINDLGWLVGSADGATKAIVMSGSEMLFLPGLGGRTSAASAISNNGLIAGRAMAPDGTVHAVIWEPVPEPTSAAVLFIGLAMLRLDARLRRSEG